MVGVAGWRGRWLELSATVASSGVDFTSSDLPIGSVLVRAWGGVEHRVYVVPPIGGPKRPARKATFAERGWGRYVYRGTRYRSLSAVAFAITGDRTLSGNRFFRLRRRRRGVRTP